MRYRAILETKEHLPRAIQSFSDSIEGVEEWAKVILKKRKKSFPDDVVRIWQTDERLVKNVYPEKDQS